MEIEEHKKNLGLTGVSRNLEEQALSLVESDGYKKLIKRFTEKQWEQSATNLPAFIIRRLPVRFTYDNNYVNDPYQGIPVSGYTQIIKKMLDSKLINVEIGVDFWDRRNEYLNFDYKIIYIGMIDQFYDYRLGELEYRSFSLVRVIREKTLLPVNIRKYGIEGMSHIIQSTIKEIKAFIGNTWNYLKKN